MDKQLWGFKHTKKRLHKTTRESVNKTNKNLGFLGNSITHTRTSLRTHEFSLRAQARSYIMRFFYCSPLSNLSQFNKIVISNCTCNCLSSQGMLLTFVSSWISSYLRLALFIFFSAVAYPSLRKFYLNCIQKARSFVDRTFHSLVMLYCLSTYGLGPVPTNVALAHELTTRQRKFFTFLHYYLFILI